METQRIKSIIKIKNSSKKYDIEVNNSHVFFANNILVHNSNFSVYISPNELKYGKKSSLLSENSDFYNFQEALKEEKIKFFIKQMQDYCKNVNSNLIFYGELFGANIQKEIYYGNERRIRFYDIYDLDKEIYLPSKLAFDTFILYGVSVPIIAENISLESALKWNNKFISTLTPEDYRNKETNICEGIVIKPLNKVYKNIDSYFVIKSKNEKFKEKEKVSKETNIKVNEHFINNPLLKTLSDEALTYVNKNRLNNVISHYGPLEDFKQFSEYQKYFMEDYQNDFINDFSNEIEQLKKIYSDKNEFNKMMKLIYSKSNFECANLIKNHIKGEN